MVTLKFELYPTIQYRLPMIIPTMKTELQTDPTFKRAGKHTIKVVAVDATTGKPVDAQIMLGDRTIGEENRPI